MNDNYKHAKIRIWLVAGSVIAIALAAPTIIKTASVKICSICQTPVPQEQLTGWAWESAESTMSFSYDNAPAHMESIAAKFSPSGWEAFHQSLTDSRILEAMEHRHLSTTLKVQKRPRITQEGVMDGRYTWLVESPIVMTYSGKDAASTPAATQGDLHLKIVRLETSPTNTIGLGIEQWVVMPRLVNGTGEK